MERVDVGCTSDELHDPTDKVNYTWLLCRTAVCMLVVFDILMQLSVHIIDSGVEHASDTSCVAVQMVVVAHGCDITDTAAACAAMVDVGCGPDCAVDVIDVACGSEVALQHSDDSLLPTDQIDRYTVDLL